MKQSINNYQFHRAFERMGKGKQFTYDGLNALFDYLEQYEDDTGETIELDVIALCCEYMEYKNIEEFNRDYNLDQEIKFIECIEDYTQVIKIDNSDGFIILQF